ncbi:MAG: hypothetical protein R2867_28270 [Caldilineaceae bacterium]
MTPPPTATPTEQPRLILIPTDTPVSNDVPLESPAAVEPAAAPGTSTGAHGYAGAGSDRYTCAPPTEVPAPAPAADYCTGLPRCPLCHLKPRNQPGALWRSGYYWQCNA